MDEFGITQINSHVRIRRASRVEEHQVARLQFLTRDTDTHRCQLTRRARQYETQGVAVDVGDETTAVETHLGIIATQSVGHADIRHRTIDDTAGHDLRDRLIERRRGIFGARRHGQHRTQRGRNDETEFGVSSYQGTLSGESFRNEGGQCIVVGKGIKPQPSIRPKQHE